MKIEHRENNIFYNVIRNETSLTEVFCNLMQYKAFRDLFLNFLNTCNEKNGNTIIDIEKIKYSDFETEKNFSFKILEDDISKKIGRGDLILTIDSIDYIVEIKIKNNTKTTKNQPDGYLEYLKEQDKKNNIDNDEYKKRLFFLIPKGYKHKDNLKKVENNILYWEDFLNKLKKSELNQLDIFINDFYNVVFETWFYFSKLDFNNIELNYIYNKEKLKMDNSAIPTIMMKLLNIVDELQDTFKANKYDESLNALEYVFWVKDSNGEKVFWFGLDYEVWEQHKNPLVIGFTDDKEDHYCQKFKECFHNKIVRIKNDENDAIYLPLDINILKSEDTLAIKNVIDDVIYQIGMSKRT